tara:strand:+ start:1410 stop:1790 length:381 start_codon:yes stop_codon:yes gene_type:complete
MKIKPENLTLQEISKILKALPELKSWISAVEEYSLNVVEEGGEIPGFELGRARSMRIWANEDEVMDTLDRTKILSLDQYNPRALLSVAKLEKLIGKQEFAILFADEVGSTVGKPKLVKTNLDHLKT